ncbi:1-acyl-sn-glycerol-3-phosphate acyltransferase [Endobacter medicaginis]|uniref:1-acyl-sn-glycerol-3-phosphate acyltransferase n=1 Tax=Endobacter medicaginis TaxID=1181271 RepID=A0A839UV25_9PROT|nr:lysophospholipid acyltransferase family protein [Endobacter medicaginis]MBB3174148.1 1-acyl-sn-glycerol-3-phosphate acyltransferase [Endobacter medicaginis]MCX5474192.1 lysophospholipid acyltransferase family protein [Endobacter medicaginis]NVN31752.1 1-acyl-sn-glycerol-3-phosphate acyltransferase [Endobacter medicaginis]
MQSTRRFPNLLRAIAFDLWFVVLTIALGVIGLFVRGFARHRSADLARLWIRLTLAGLRTIAGISWVVEGRENLEAHRGRPVLIASQHRSAFDTLVWFLILDHPAYVMKQELRKIPLVGPLLEPAGMIPVDRSAGAAALRGLLAAAEAAVATGHSPIIFPEGTRVPAGHVAKLQPGVAALAAHLAIPVLPVATDSGRHWGLGWFDKRPGTIHIAIGPALPGDLRRRPLLDAIETAWQSGQTRLEPGA